MIQPLDHGTNQVTVQAREELAEHIGHSEPKIISDQNLAILSRQLALHANVNIIKVFTERLNQQSNIIQYFIYYVAGVHGLFIFETKQS